MIWSVLCGGSTPRLACQVCLQGVVQGEKLQVPHCSQRPCGCCTLPPHLGRHGATTRAAARWRATAPGLHGDGMRGTGSRPALERRQHAVHLNWHSASSPRKSGGPSPMTWRRTVDWPPSAPTTRRAVRGGRPPLKCRVTCEPSGLSSQRSNGACWCSTPGGRQLASAACEALCQQSRSSRRVGGTASQAQLGRDAEQLPSQAVCMRAACASTALVGPPSIHIILQKQGRPCLQGVPGAGAEGAAPLADVLHWAVPACQHNRLRAIWLQVPAGWGGADAQVHVADVCGWLVRSWAAGGVQATLPCTAGWPARGI